MPNASTLISRHLAHLAKGLKWLLCGGVLTYASWAWSADYPRQVTDLAGREVTLEQAPERIVLQDSNDLMILSILLSETPYAGVVGWQNTLKGSDPALWSRLATLWPDIQQVPELSFDASGQINAEAIVSLEPDLVIARLPAREAIENGQLGRLLDVLDIPLLYVDTEYDPLVNVSRSIALLGEALNRTASAQAYNEDYRVLLENLMARVRELPNRRVFVEVRAGEAGDECCKTHGSAAWGNMIERLGATNLAHRYLNGLASGTVALEALTAEPPDTYVMTGTQRTGRDDSSIPFGYLADEESIAQRMAALVERPGFAALTQDHLSCVQGVHHQFYNNVFNVVGLGYLAKAIWPEALATLSPGNDYRTLIERHTSLPGDTPFIFSAEHCLPGGENG